MTAPYSLSTIGTDTQDDTTYPVNTPKGDPVAQYILIESRDPFEYGDSLYMYDLAGDLSAKGNDVTLFLVQNGVLTTRKAVKDNPLPKVQQRAPGIVVQADDFSLRERGISTSNLVDGVSVSSVDDLVNLLVQDDAKLVWH